VNWAKHVFLTTQRVIKYFSPDAYIFQAATASKEMTLRKSISLVFCNKKRGNSDHPCENTGPPKQNVVIPNPSLNLEHRLNSLFVFLPIDWID